MSELPGSVTLEGSPNHSITASRAGMMALVAVLVQRLGGEVKVSQADFDIIGGYTLLENVDLVDGLTLKLELTGPGEKLQ